MRENLDRQIETAHEYLDTFRQYASEEREKSPRLEQAVEGFAILLDELKVAQEELRQQNDELAAVRDLVESERARYQDLFNLAPDAYLVTDRDGVILEVNATGFALLNVPVGFLAGRPLALFVSPDDRPALDNLLAHLREGGEASGREWRTYLQPHKRERVPVAISMSPVRDAGGSVSGVRWLLRDLTATRQAEERERLLIQIAKDREAIGELAEDLERERDILETIMENTHAQLAYLDRDFNFVRVNSAYAQGAGYAGRDLIGRNHFALFPNVENEAIFEGVRDVGEPVHYRARPFEYLDQPEHGTTYWDWTLVPVKNARGQVQGLVFSLLDVTEAERGRQERERYLARLNRLIEVSQEILAERTAQGVLQHAVDAARELTGAAIGLAGHNFDGQEFRVWAASWSDTLHPPASRETFAFRQGGVYLELLETESSIHLSDEELKSHPAWRGVPAGHMPLDGLLGARLVDMHGRATGLVMVSRKEGGEFTAEDRALLTQLAAQTSLGLQHVEARDDSEQRAEELNAVFRAMTDAVVVCDAGGRVIHANPAAARAYGIDPLEAGREATGAVSVERLAKRHPGGRPATQEELPSTRSLRGEHVENETYSMTTDAGEEKIVLVSAAPLVADGQVSGAVLAWHDITERDAARREVERLAARDRAILESMTEGLIVMDLDGNIVDMNPAALAMHGFERVEEARRHLRQYPDLFEAWTIDGQPLGLDDWPAARVLRGERLTGFELKVQRTDTGQFFIASYGGSPVLDESGRRILNILTLHNVTAERSAERDRDRLVTILESTPDIVFTASESGNVFYLNKAGRELLGIRGGTDLNGVNIREYQPAWARRLVENRGLRHVLEEGIWQGETAFLRHDGREIPVSEVLIAHRAVDGTVEYLSSIARDISERQKSSRQLEAERARFKAVIENAPEAVVVSDPQGRIVMANPAAEHLFGRPIPFGEEFDLHSDLALCDPQGEPYDPRDLPLTRSALNGEAFRNVEMSVCSPPGETQSLLVSSAPIRTVQGRIAGAVGIFQDITERKQIQRALSRYAERLRILHDVDLAILSAPSLGEIAEGMLRHLRQLVPCVRSSVALFDLEAKEVTLLAAGSDETTRLGKGWHGPLEPDWPVEELARGEVVKVKDTTVVPASHPLGEILREEGVRAYVNVPLFAQGQLIGALNLGVARPGELEREEMDVVQEMAAELAIGIQQMRLNEQVQKHAHELEQEVARRTAALQASEARLRTIFEGAAIGISLADVEGRILQTNPALDRMLGYSAGELRGKLFAEFTHPEDAKTSVDAYRDMVRGKCGEYNLQKRYVRKDGGIIWGNLTVSLVRSSEGEPLYAVGMVEDVTERKQIQEALLSAEKLAVAGRMGASLAHEINNPLQSVIGCLGLAEKSLPQDADAGRYLGVARQELRRAARIVGQLRDMGRPAQAEEKREVDFNPMVDEVLVLSRKQAQEHGVDLIWEPAEALPRIQAAPDRLRQVFLNLILNAFDAMPQGGRLRVTTARTDSPEGVRISFSDTGTGMTSDALSQLFDPFYTTKSQGLGLGLYISHNIVQEHGGHIHATSRLGEGTTFTVWLPA